MKNYLHKTITFILLIATFSCNNKDDEPLETVALTFTQETAEDQMGGFADNAMALFNSKTWSIAGINVYSTPNFHHDVWFSNNSIAWVSVADNFNIGRRGTTLTNFNGKLWAIGGEDNMGNAQADVWSSTDGETWVSELSIAPFEFIKFHQTIVFQNKLFVIAGNSTTNNTEVWSSTNGIDWTQETANAFSGRGGHRAVVFDNALYVIGGEATTFLNDVWKSTNGADWEQIPIQGTIFPRIGGHTATVYNGKVWVIGGRTDTADFSKDIYYSSDMLNWSKYEATIPLEAIAFHNTLNYNNALWIFGGYKSGGLSGEIWKITE